jgi:hypothetical protein
MLILGFPAQSTDVDYSLVLEALRLADISQEKAAEWMEINKAQLHRQLHGEGHLSLRRLAMLPGSFWSWYGVLILDKYPLPREVQRAARLVFGLIGKKRMARLEAQKVRRVA